MQPGALATLDPAQIETLRNGLRIMALRALADADLAEDVAQEALFRGLQSITPECAADPARLGAFMGGIARHVIADVRRRSLRSTNISAALPVSAGIDALTTLVHAEERAAVQKALHVLSERDRAILHDSFFLGMTPAEVAEISGEPAPRVRKRKSRAMERLRAALEGARHDVGAAASNNVRSMLQPAMKGGQ